MVEFSVDSVLKELTPIFKTIHEDTVISRNKIPKSEKPYSYFARAIRGGRGNLENDRIIVNEMEKYSTVLSKHTVLDEVKKFEREWKKRFPKIPVRARDLIMIIFSKRFVADFTIDSTGVGYEINDVYTLGIPSTLFCHEEAKYRPTMKRAIVESGKGLIDYSEPTFEEVLKSHDVKIPIVYYNDQNIKEIAEREVRNLFSGI